MTLERSWLWAVGSSELISSSSNNHINNKNFFPSKSLQTLHRTTIDGFQKNCLNRLLRSSLYLCPSWCRLLLRAVRTLGNSKKSTVRKVRWIEWVGGLRYCVMIYSICDYVFLLLVRKTGRAFPQIFLFPTSSWRIGRIIYGLMCSWSSIDLESFKIYGP